MTHAIPTGMNIVPWVLLTDSSLDSNQIVLICIIRGIGMGLSSLDRTCVDTRIPCTRAAQSRINGAKGW